jgi:cob(I)alamin adenosyltransferase
MKIYTKFGDKGQTKLGNGITVSKSDPWIRCYGTIDELSCWLGWICHLSSDEFLRKKLQAIQNQLFYLGAELCKSHQKYEEISKDITKMEEWIDGLSTSTVPIRNFILPGGTGLSSAFHVARTVCRRCEIELVEAAKTEKKYEKAMTYLNRLSDLLFCLARYYNNLGKSDVIWQPNI